jgi:hypothetical protein
LMMTILDPSGPAATPTPMATNCRELRCKLRMGPRCAYKCHAISVVDGFLSCGSWSGQGARQRESAVMWELTLA